jgi:hypothetical protein
MASSLPTHHGSLHGRIFQDEADLAPFCRVDMSVDWETRASFVVFSLALKRFPANKSAAYLRYIPLSDFAAFSPYGGV